MSPNFFSFGGAEKFYFKKRRARPGGKPKSHTAHTHRAQPFPVESRHPAWASLSQNPPSPFSFCALRRGVLSVVSPAPFALRFGPTGSPSSCPSSLAAALIFPNARHAVALPPGATLLRTSSSLGPEVLWARNRAPWVQGAAALRPADPARRPQLSPDYVAPFSGLGGSSLPSRASSRLRLAPGGGLLRQHTVVLRRRFAALRSEQDQDPAEVGVQFLRFFGGRAAEPGFPPCTEDSSPEPNGNMRNEIKQKEEMRKVIFVRPFPPPQGETAASTGNATEAVPGPTQEKILLQTYPTQEASPFSEKGRQRRPRGVALHMPSGRSLVSNRPCPRGVAIRVRVGKIPVLRSPRAPRGGPQSAAVY